MPGAKQTAGQLRVQQVHDFIDRRFPAWLRDAGDFGNELPPSGEKEKNDAQSHKATPSAAAFDERN